MEFYSVIEKTFFENEDAGFATPFAKKENKDDSKLLQVVADEVPNKGEIRIRGGLQKTGAGGLNNFSKLLKCELTEAQNFDPDDARSAKFLVHPQNFSVLSKWECCEVIDHEKEVASLLSSEHRLVSHSHKPTEIVFIRDLQAAKIFGPLEVKSVVPEGVEVAWESATNYLIEVRPIETRQVPPHFKSLVGKRYTMMEIAESPKTLDCLFETTGEKVRTFFEPKSADVDRDVKIVDASNNPELAVELDKHSRFITDDPAAYIESLGRVKELLKNQTKLDDQIWSRRIERIFDLDPSTLPAAFNDLKVSKGDIRDLEEDPSAIKQYVEENAQDLIKKYALKELNREQKESETELDDLKRQVKREKQELVREQKKNQLAQAAGVQLEEKRKALEENLANIEVQYEKEMERVAKKRESELVDLDLKVEVRRRELDQLNNDVEEKSRLEKELYLKIGSQRETYTSKLVEHASIIDALQGRHRPKIIIDDFRLQSATNAEPDEIVLQVVDELVLNLDSAGRTLERLECLGLAICVAQNFMTVFFGDPGSGKTSLVNLLGDIFCQPEVFGDERLFTEIQVQRGWTNSQEFMGFQNVLNNTREYDRYGFFRRIEALNSNQEAFVNLPYFVLLDEANLSPVEHYWSDFMGLTDRFYTSPKLLDLPARSADDEGSEIQMPPGLRFLATINSDETTEGLSARFVNRSAFFKVVTPPSLNFGRDARPVAPLNFSLEDLHHGFRVGGQTGLDELRNDEILKSLARDFPWLSLTTRKQLSVRRFLSVAEPFLENENEELATALDLALIHLVCPSIRGQFTEFGEELKRLETDLKRQNLLRAADAVQEIRIFGDSNNGFYSAL